MESFYDNNYYTAQNNINYYYTIAQTPENNNSIYNTYTQAIKNYKIPSNQYAINTYPYLTETVTNYASPNINILYDTTNLNAYNYNNTQYINTTPNIKTYKTITINPYQNQQRNIKLYPNQNIVNNNRTPSLQTYNYKIINNNNIQPQNMKRANTINNVNQIQKVKTMVQKPIKNIVYNNINVDSLSTGKKRISMKRPIQNNNINNNIHIKPKVHATHNNIKVNFNNIFENIQQKEHNNTEIIETAKVTKITNNINKENNFDLSNLITIPDSNNNNNNQATNNLRYSNYIQTENIPNITNTYNFELINNVNSNNQNNKNYMTQSAHFPNKKPKLNNEQNYYINYENLDSYFDNNNNQKVQKENQLNYDVQPKSNNNQKINIINNNNILKQNTIPTLFEVTVTKTEPKIKILPNIENSPNIKTQTPFFSLNGELISNSKSEKYFRQTNTAPVKSYGYYQNQGQRSYMEDEGKVIENLNGDQNKILFCLFDGHGGGQVSKFLQNNFGNYMKKILNSADYNLAFTNLFKLIDEDIKKLNCPSVGSTATIVYIEKKDNKRILYCANIGDSRCVLVKKNKVVRLSYDHRVADQNEKQRIISNGGIIVNGRVYGILMLSRSFGDFLTKDFGVIVTPYVTKVELTEDDLYCVIASDGVWDVIKDNDCAVLPKMGLETGELSKRIIQESLKRKSKDNLSCFVVKLN